MLKEFSSLLPFEETVYLPGAQFMEQLIDNFGRTHSYLRVSVTDRCNLRCAYCMPANGIKQKPREEILSYEEITRMVQLFAGSGITKVRITGGEPTVRKGLENLIRAVKGISGIETIGMTTNGTTLKNEAAGLLKSGISRLNISLDTLKRDRFIAITQSDSLHHVLDGIDTALAAGFEHIKINTVVIAGTNDDEILDFLKYVVDRPVTLRFIEYMPFKDNRWHKDGLLPWKQIYEQVSLRYKLESCEPDSVTTVGEYRIKGTPARIGFIAPVSEPFCGKCNRLRLTADGSVKVCLMNPVEANVREALRSGCSDEQLIRLIHTAVTSKPYAHLRPQEIEYAANRCMIQIGG